MNGWLEAITGSGELSRLPGKSKKAGRRVPNVAAVLLALGLLTVLLGTALGIEAHNAAPALAGVNSAPDRSPAPADPPITVTTVVTQTSVTTVTAAPTTVTTTSLTTVATTVYTTITTTVPGAATSTVYVCGGGYHYQSGQCVGNGPVVN